jgi:GntR family transcriptional regulator
VVHKRRGVGIFVSRGARDRLLAQRRERFFADVVAPVAAEARLLGVPLEDVVARLRLLDGQDAAPTGAQEEQR